MPDANVVLKGSFTAAAQTYKVKYLDEDTLAEIHTTLGPKNTHFGDVIEGYTEKIEISGYTFVRAEDLTVETDNEKNIVTVYYSKDANKDDIPDKYQITFTYVSADADKGTVTGKTSEVATTYEITRDSVTGEIIVGNGPTAQHPTQPSTVTPKDGYRFEKWQQDDLTFFNSDDELRNSEYLEDQTFIAHFTVRRDLHYEIHYFYEDANGVVTEDTAAAIVSDIGVFGEKILTTTVPKESEFNGKNYVLERIEGADKQIGLDPKENMVNVYYSMDEIGEIDPDEPDNIPDKYQVTFQYISENPSYGTVSGKVKEVVTRPKNADGTYNMTAPVHPKAEVTVAGIGNYKFNRWSDGNTNYSAASEIAKAGFIADTTFTAYFSYSGGNSGGGSSGGGGGGSHRSTISNTSGGPGVTTTITPGDVPMAELPESPAPIVIDDGEIPMAALPKTGQTTVKAALTMMFSGIFLALTAIGRKKKEQDV